MQCFYREAQSRLTAEVEGKLSNHCLADVTDPCAGFWPAQTAEQFAALAIR